jgi:aminomethyltransferase
MSEKQTPFFAKHLEAGARMVPFAGYRMPLQYAGIQREHLAVRERVGLFDLSHMGEFLVRGSGSLEFLQAMTTNDVAALADGQVQYTAMCYPHGGIVDDLLVYNRSGEFMLVVNAANIDRDRAWLLEHKPPEVELVDASDRIGLLAIQGPRAEHVMSKIVDYPLPELPFYWSAVGSFGSREMVFSRTGYTGEDGFEIYCPVDAAAELWPQVVQAGMDDELELIGLGARDSLRLEMRYALYGHEIDQDTNPIAAGLGWICKPEKGDFIGRDAIVKMKEEKPAERLVCLELGPRAIPREGYAVQRDGDKIGHVRSGVFSPSLKRGIATAYVPRALAGAGTDLQVKIRDRLEPATVVKPPFYKGGSHK